MDSIQQRIVFSYTGSTVTATPGTTTIYTVTGTDSGGCSSSTNVTVVYGGTSPTITITSSFCHNFLQRIGKANRGGGSTYSWFPNQGLSATSGGYCNGESIFNHYLHSNRNECRRMHGTQQYNSNNQLTIFCECRP